MNAHRVTLLRERLAIARRDLFNFNAHAGGVGGRAAAADATVRRSLDELAQTLASNQPMW